MEFHSYPKECAFRSVADIKGKKITVMGLGLNGGGEAAVRFFLKKGAQVLVTDMKTEQQLRPTIERLQNDPALDTSRLSYRLGEHRLEDFSEADCVIKNPGVKYEGNAFLAAARAIETDLSIFLRFTECPIIAVTGSKGKSSTVSAIYYGLKKAGFTAFLGGNITVSPLTFFDDVTSDTPVVIEFSSWQLADLRGRGVLRPHIAIITKIVPDHQNWYGNMEDYVADKRLIYAGQTAGDYAIFDNEDEYWGDLFAAEAKATVLRFGNSDLNKNGEKKYGVWQDTDENGAFAGKVLLPNMKKPEIILRDRAVPGEHMKINILNAALVLYLMGIPAEKTAEICGSWPGIEHRLQYFHSWKNANGTEFRFYNDSCATVAEAAVAATQSFGTPVHLITGGTDKGLELTPLVHLLNGDDKNAIPVKSAYFLEGTATEKILPELKTAFHGPFPGIPELLGELKTELENARGKTETVVFSPGATSFGMFQNEFDRGTQFMNAVKTIF